MGNRKLVKSFLVTGNIEHFRSFMERLRNNLSSMGEWLSSGGEVLAFHYEPKQKTITVGETHLADYAPQAVEDLRQLRLSSGRTITVDVTPANTASWEVVNTSSHPLQMATINAYELTPGKVQVDFLDACVPHLFYDHYLPIGPAFEEFSQWILEEVSKAGLLLETYPRPPAGGNGLGLVGDFEDSEKSTTLLTTRKPIELWVRRFVRKNSEWISDRHILSVNDEETTIKIGVWKKDTNAPANSDENYDIAYPGVIMLGLYPNWPDKTRVKGRCQPGYEAAFNTLWAEMVAEFGEQQRPNAESNWDVYVRYETGLDRLLRKIGQSHDRYNEALVYEHRLRANIAKSRRYGDNDTQRAELNEIVDRLNELALAVLGVTFNELCD